MTKKDLERVGDEVWKLIEPALDAKLEEYRQKGFRQGVEAAARWIEAGNIYPDMSMAEVVAADRARAALSREGGGK